MGYYNNIVDFAQLIGKTLVSVEVGKNNDYITFTTDQGEKFEMYHDQDCCESVTIDSITGDLSQLVGYPILSATDNCSTDNPSDVDTTGWYQDSFTWTFYDISTIKGTVSIRWYGESNGYYGESVDLHYTAGPSAPKILN